jgi:hypothetical protein
MDNRGKTMIDGKFAFGFAVDWMRKDPAQCRCRKRCRAQRPRYQDRS